MSVTANPSIVREADVPRENLFMVGLIANKTTRDLFSIARPRKPFVVNRQEALNLIGYLITHADFTVADIEQTIRDWSPSINIFNVQGDEKRVHIDFPTNVRIYPKTMSDFERDALLTAATIGLFLFTMEEGKNLAAALTHTMSLKPKELDGAVVAIFEHARDVSGVGQSLSDMLKMKAP
jgi:hypothetical protein